MWYTSVHVRYLARRAKHGGAGEWKITGQLASDPDRQPPCSIFDNLLPPTCVWQPQWAAEDGQPLALEMRAFVVYEGPLEFKL